MKPANQSHTLTFDEAGHVYTLDGAVVASVTEIIKPLSDFTRVPEAVLENKRSLGKAVHKAIELWEQQDLNVDELDPLAIPFFEAWLKFKEDNSFRALIVEQPVASAKFRCAGTPDVLGTRGPGTTPDEILDVKCVWKMDPATGVQIAGYEELVAEWTGVKIKRRTGVQLLSDGNYRPHSYTHKNDRNVFFACHSIHAWKGLSK